MTLIPGTRLGVYDVAAQIGEGGMGQVYRATDTRLNRQVAIKILPPSFAADPDRLARFEREATVLASLNQPNIAVIYGLEDADGVKALVMELVEGEDLSQRIGRGAIPLDEALKIAKQVADALEAAHERGIVHRDLKPANLKLRPDGVVKVLDFGLAKALDPAASSSDASQLATLASPLMTQQGVILGTAAYMSPEQARGKTVDKRPTWSRTKHELFYGSANGQLMVATFTMEGDSFRAEKPRLWSDGHFITRGPNRMFDLHPDGERFALVSPEPIQGLGQDRTTFVFNFFDELRRIAPVGLR